MAKRLTAAKFKKLLEAHPKFALIEGGWIQHSIKRGQPCGGCAMALAYKDANPSVRFNRLSSKHCEVGVWANGEYGTNYVDCFVAAFDGELYLDDDDLSDGEKDGLACRKLAFKLGRLI